MRTSSKFLSLAVLSFFLVMPSRFAFAENTGIALVRRQLPELVAAFESNLPRKAVADFFSGWNVQDCEEFQLKTMNLTRIISETPRRERNAHFVEDLNHRYRRRLIGLVGEIWSVAHARKQSSPPIQLLHEFHIHTNTAKGNLVDGLAFTIIDGNFTLHKVIESKLGHAYFAKDQVTGFLSNIKRNGLTVGGVKYSPEQILIRINGGDKPIVSANLRDLKKVEIDLTVQSAGYFDGLGVNRTVFPIPVDTLIEIKNDYLGRIANLSEPERQIFLAHYRKIKTYRERIHAIAKILDHGGGIFHRLFEPGTVLRGDLSNILKNTPSTLRIVDAIMNDKIRTPPYYRDLGFNPKAFLLAGDSDATKILEKVNMVHPTDSGELNRRRKRILEMYRLFNANNNFHQYFPLGLIAPGDIGKLRSSPDRIRKISRAILEGKMVLPSEFSDAGFDPKSYLLADDTMASKLSLGVRELRPQDSAEVERRRERVLQISEITQRTGKGFAELFADGTIPKSALGNLKKGSTQEVHRISSAIIEGRMQLPSEWNGIPFDPVAFMKAPGKEARALLKKANAEKKKNDAQIAEWRSRILRLVAIVGRRHFFDQFKEGSLLPGDYGNFTEVPGSVVRIAEAMQKGQFLAAGGFADSGFDPSAFMGSSDKLALIMLDRLKASVDAQSSQSEAESRRLAQRILELGELMGKRGDSFHTLFSGKSVGENDYSNIKQGGQTAVSRVAEAIAKGRMKVPAEYRFTGFDPVAYLNADNKAARALAAPLIHIRPLDPLEIERRRIRIKRMQEWFTSTKNSFSKLFARGLLSEFDIAVIGRGATETIQRVGLAILKGKMLLPDRYSLIQFDPAKYLVASVQEAKVIEKKVLQLSPVSKEGIAERQERIVLLGEALMARGTAFSQLFEKGFLEQSDYTLARGGAREAIHRISAAIFAGKMLLPQDYIDAKIDPKEFLLASNKQAQRLANTIRSVTERIVEERWRSQAIPLPESTVRGIQRLYELAELAGKTHSDFSSLFPRGVISSSDYTQLKFGGGAYHVVFNAILNGKLKLPPHLKGKLDPKAFIRAAEKDALRMTKNLPKLAPRDSEEIERRRRRIIGIADIFDSRRHKFHTLFVPGSLAENTFAMVTNGGEKAVHSASKAILLGEFRVPKKFKDLDFDPIAFLNSSDSEADKVIAKFKNLTETNLAGLDQKRRRISELASLLGVGSHSFHKLFTRGNVGPNTLSHLHEGSKALETIVFAIEKGWLKLPGAIRDAGFDAKEYLYSDDQQAAVLAKTVTALRPSDPREIELRRNRIAHLAKLLGVGSKEFAKLFEPNTVKPSDLNTSKYQLESFQRISMAIMQGKMTMVPAEWGAEGFSPKEYLMGGKKKDCAGAFARIEGKGHSTNRR